MTKTLIMAAALLFPWAAHAGAHYYQCTVLEELHVSDDGGLSPYPRPLAKGKRFSIDRDSGALIGPNDPSEWIFRDASISILARGNSQNSFVVTYTSKAAGSGVHFATVSVEEFAMSRAKPFMATSGRGVYSGVCE